MKKIGVFDSGIGGLTIFFALVDKYPSNEYIYVSDQKHNPYGEKTKEQLLEYATNIVTFFMNKQCDEIVVACNTICATVLGQLQKLFPNIIFHSVIEPLVEKINQSDYQNVLVLSTLATKNSQIYQKLLNKKNTVIATVDFVPKIENMELENIDSTIEKYLKNYRLKADIVVLACTHYPIIKKEISEYMQVDTYDAIEVMVEKLHALSNNTQTPKQSIYTSGDPIKLQNQIYQIFNRKYTVYKL